MKANGHHTIRQAPCANKATATPAARPMLGEDAEQDAAMRAANQAAAAREARDRALLDVADLLIGETKAGVHALDMATRALGSDVEENALYFLNKTVEEKVERALAIVDAAMRAANQAAAERAARDRALLDLADVIGEIKSGLRALDMATSALGDDAEKNAFRFILEALRGKAERASAIVAAALNANRCRAAE
jgi:signal transduction histidine kinase